MSKIKLGWSAKIAVAVAVVIAASGVAYAGSKYVITSVKQIRPSVRKALKGGVGPVGPAGAKGDVGPEGKVGVEGKVGPQGPVGRDGAQGAEGPEGRQGATGPTGPTGREGPEGADGTSVVSRALTVSDSACEKRGGGEFTTGATVTYACNGSPWTAGGTLPRSATETGVFNVSSTPVNVAGNLITATALDFPVPLAAALDNAHVHVITPGNKGAGGGCPTTSELAKPEAEAGNLCLFEGVAENVFIVASGNPETGGTGAGRTGAGVSLISLKNEVVIFQGTWAVTAE